MSEKFDEIKFEKIDTKDSVKRFAETIQENKTYFLDGKWGSGKTEFIENAKNYLTEKVIQVDLWRVSDNRSITEIVFSRMHKCYYLIIKYGVILLIALSILYSKEVNFGWTFGKLWLNNLVKIVIWTFTASVAWFQFLGRKSDDLFIRLLKCNLRDKLLIFDDFDRVKPDNQEEAYKIFNLLNGQLPILFVGDYDKLVKNEDNYLQKIIDQKIVLPYNLHSSEIVRNVELPDSIKQLFKLESRVIRELVHFIEISNQELEGKFKKVQFEQQLLIIYTYLFYPKIYAKLKGGWRPEKAEDENGTKSFMNELSSGLASNKNVPRDFQSNPQAYFLYENATNLSTSDLVDIFNDDTELQKQLEQTNKDDETYKEVSNYIENMDINVWRDFSERVEKLAIKQIKDRVKPNVLTKYVFKQKMTLLENIIDERFIKEIEHAKTNNVPEEVTKSETRFIFNELDKFFQSSNIDDSQQIYFYHEFIDIRDEIVDRNYNRGYIIKLTPRINKEVIIKEFSDTVNKLLDTNEYVNQNFPEQILIAKLGFNYQELSEDGLKILKNKILDLSDEEFKYFWNFYNMKPYQDNDKVGLKGGVKLRFDKGFYDSVLERLIEIDEGTIGE